ncbi:MAG: hypothetical protein A3J47_04175 [Candidatus Yanofskybacteria bacterium RIFCSPHIGHO2_02_FULL_43_22]|uniref:DUF5658 domain-containing protein n=1 Tax=Candidatus Yanofskybacteria bacterium RIFCSPHIGHO2_02_FULL_43_22 TaxID=1802681 RepID=A0A1F8FS86_9BACT|nr:MAG: hypothetical protein A3J47_04175 [Candidatus Yanofskybacteria bacterium RIFCSPHIGHO2_02_FULL_43_22]
MLRKAITFAVLFFIIGSNAFAQTQEKKTADKKFWAINSLMIGSTIYDIESTYLTLDRCATCYEKNPLMRSFVESGRPAAYSVQMAINGGIIYASYEMKKSQRFRKVWWAIPVAVTVAHVVAGTHNIRLGIKF